VTTPERAIRDGPWCTVCGTPATETEPTLDPSRPLGVCRRVFTDTTVRCGRVVVTYHRAEADDVYRARRWKVTTAHHYQHDPERDPVPFCRKCQELPLPLDAPTIGTDTGATQASGAHRKESRT
jgi:hypothetical protein